MSHLLTPSFMSLAPLTEEALLYLTTHKFSMRKMHIHPLLDQQALGGIN